MRSQVLRAADSIPSNLAEGCAKNSRFELARFAETAYASAKEVLSHLMLCGDRKVLPDSDLRDLIERTDHVARLCYGLQRMNRKKE